MKVRAPDDCNPYPLGALKTWNQNILSSVLENLSESLHLC